MDRYRVLRDTLVFREAPPAGFTVPAPDQTFAAIGEISQIIQRINDYQVTIASAVEEQTATTAGSRCERHSLLTPAPLIAESCSAPVVRPQRSSSSW
jgi:hypothetical protein